MGQMDINQVRRVLGEHDSPQVKAIRKKAGDALRILEVYPDYPRVHLGAIEKAEAEYKTTGRNLPEALIPNPERLAYQLKLVDIWASAYLQLVSNLESHRLFMDVLRGLAQQAWDEYRGIAPISPKQTEAGAVIADRLIHWEKESWKRLIPPSKTLTDDEAPVMRRGYRNEIDEWMSRKEIATLDVAARELGVSVDVLKSIRSDKGQRRYSNDTLVSVLTKIGVSE